MKIIRHSRVSVRFSDLFNISIRVMAKLALRHGAMLFRLANSNVPAGRPLHKIGCAAKYYNIFSLNASREPTSLLPISTVGYNLYIPSIYMMQDASLLSLCFSFVLRITDPMPPHGFLLIEGQIGCIVYLPYVYNAENANRKPYSSRLLLVA